jgi:hypothetical protein
MSRLRTAEDQVHEITDLANTIALQADAVAGWTASSLRGAAVLIEQNAQQLLVLVAELEAQNEGLPSLPLLAVEVAEVGDLS